VLETYGSRLAADAAAIEVREPGDVYARDDFVYWGFPLEGLQRLGARRSIDRSEAIDLVEGGGE